MYKFITKNEFDSIQECKCGGPIFKYHDTTENTMTAKCGYVSKIIDFEKETKKKIWVPAKKQPCNFKCRYHGTRPVFQEIHNKIEAVVNKRESDPNKNLEERLRILFKFLIVCRYDHTLHEINIIVKNSLQRETIKKFYYPNVNYLKFSHYEPFEDYRDRIFSQKIIELQPPLKIIKPEATVVFLKHPILSRISSPIDPPTPVIKKSNPQFICASEYSGDSDIEKSDDESLSEYDSDRGDSDFESVLDNESVLDDPENISDNEFENEHEYYDDD